MDWTTLIAAVLSAVVSLSVCLINSNTQANKTRMENEKVLSLIKYQLDEHKTLIDDLRKEVKENNQVKDRMLRAEGTIDVLKANIEDLNRRIEKLEDK